MTPLDARRDALERACRELTARATPRGVRALRDAAGALAPGAWIPSLEQSVTGLLLKVPVAPVGAAVFPAVGAPRADGRPSVVEIHVCVTVRARGADEVAAPDEATALAVSDALEAARRWLGVPSPGQGGAALVVAFSPSTGWTGGSCGLGVALAAVSAMRDTPLRRCCWATGRVAADGRVLTVEGVAQKVLASAGRTLLVPAADGALPQGTRAVQTLGQAVNEALAEPPSSVLVDRMARHTRTWLEGRGFDLGSHVRHAVDDRLAERWGAGERCVAIVGAPATGTRWRLAWLATHVSPRANVLLLEPLGDDTAAALAEGLSQVLSAETHVVGNDTCIDTWLDTLERIARDTGLPVLLGLVRPGPVVRGLLRARFVHTPAAPALDGVRCVWTQDADDNDDGVTRVVCPDDLLAGRAEVLVARGLPPALWTPENRVVLATPLALDVVKALGEDGWPSGVLLRNDLLQEVREAAFRRVGRIRAIDWAWSSLAEHLRVAPRAPWRPRGGPRGHAEACARLVRAGVVVAVPQGFRVVDPTLALALSAGDIERIAFGEGPLPEPGRWLAERAAAGGVASPWDDVLVRGFLGPVAGAALERWFLRCAEAVRHAWSGTVEQRCAVLELAAGLARADLLRPGRRPSTLARLLASVAQFVEDDAVDDLVACLASGAALAVVHDTWPLAWRRRRRALRVLDACVTSMVASPRAQERLVTLRSMLGSPEEVVRRLEALPVTLDASEEPAWAPLVHAAVFEQGWPGASDTPSASMFQEALAEVYWRRCTALPDGEEEARAVAHGRLRAALAQGDTLAAERWRRRDPRYVPHTLGGSAERALARMVLVNALVRAP